MELVKEGPVPTVFFSSLAAQRHTSSAAKAVRKVHAGIYLVCKGDRRDFCIIDPGGKEHSLAKRIDGAKAAEVRERMADIDREELPSVAEGRGERRDDSKQVENAVAAGAKKNKVAAAINAARAAQVIALPQDNAGERERRDESEKSVRQRRKEAKEPMPEKETTQKPPREQARPSWQAREQRRERDNDREPQR
jgi:hypothetical protein